MTYMTFKIKKDWLFWTLLSVSAVFNIVVLVLFISSIVAGQTELVVVSCAMTLVSLAMNGYLIYCLAKGYKLGLTRDSIQVSDLSRVTIPYNKIRSIKKDREPSKYKLYDALLIIKYNKYDSLKVNVNDLENCYDNIKELVQKSNVNKKVTDIVYKADGSIAKKEEQAK